MSEFQNIFHVQKCPKCHITICLSSDQNTENLTCRFETENSEKLKKCKLQKCKMHV